MRGTPSLASPTLVLTDFGLAQITDHTAITVTGHKVSSAIGISCRYAAPELWQAIYDAEQPETKLDPKATDIYAFAVVIWELLYRAVPWKSASNETIRNFLSSRRRTSI